MSNVHSARLAIGEAVATGATTVYTVPTGKRTIVKGIDAFNFNTALNRLYVEVHHGVTLLSYLIVTCAGNPSLDESKHAQVWTVLNTGDSLKVDSNLNGIWWIISGAELTL